MATALLNGASSAQRANLAGAVSGSRSSPPPPAGLEERSSEHYLDIFLRKHNPRADLKLTPEEISRLVFETLAIPRDRVMAVSQGDLRYVELKLNTDPTPWQNLEPLWVKDGITTSGAIVEREMVAWVHLHGAPLRTSNEKIKEIFEPFGQIMSRVTPLTYKDDPDCPLTGLLNGGRKWSMKLTSDIPTFCFVEGRRCRVYYTGNKKRCNYCGKIDVDCPGEANFQNCKDNYGVRANLEEVWDQIRSQAIAAKQSCENNYLTAAANHHQQLEEQLGEALLRGDHQEQEQEQRGLRRPKVKGMKKSNAELSDDIEIFKVPLNVDSSDVTKALLAALQVNRAAANPDWRIFKIKPRCWLIRGLNLEEREVVFKAKIKIEGTGCRTRPSTSPLDLQEILANQTGMLPPAENQPKGPVEEKEEEEEEMEEGEKRTPASPATLTRAETRPLPPDTVRSQPEVWNQQLESPTRQDPMTSTSREGMDLPLVHFSPQVSDEDEGEWDIDFFVNQKSRGYKKRNRSGNSSRNSAAKPSPKKINLNASQLFSPEDVILEEAVKLSRSCHDPKGRDIEGFEMDLDGTDDSVDPLVTFLSSQGRHGTADTGQKDDPEPAVLREEAEESEDNSETGEDTTNSPKKYRSRLTPSDIKGKKRNPRQGNKQQSYSFRPKTLENFFH